MRKPLLIAAAVLGLSATAAVAQPAPPPPPPEGHGGPGGMGWMHRGPEGHEMHHGIWHHMNTFGLLHRPADRALSGADVQKIAEGFLLWNGNHTWKITGVTEQDDSTVGFNIATASCDVIARFTMNRHTGQITRVS